jgi:hypothetical protein
MGMEAAFSSLYWITSPQRRQNGPFALEWLMALMCGRLAILLNRMVPLKWLLQKPTICPGKK